MQMALHSACFTVYVCPCAAVPGICVSVVVCAATLVDTDVVPARFGPMRAAMHVVCALGVVLCSAKRPFVMCAHPAVACAARHLLLLLFSARAVCIAVQAAAGHACHVDT
jgi:hypothetical protein